MSLLQINKEICKQDGFCVQECPVVIISMQDKNSFPEILPGKEEMCIECGHCVAVCPHGALSHEKVPLESCPLVDREKVINDEQAIQFLRSRRSARKFKDKPLEKSQIENLINIARYAPTGSNAQNLEWTVITGKDNLWKISELTVDWIRDALKGPYKDSFPNYFNALVLGWDFGIDVVLRNAPAVVMASSPGEGNGGLVNISIALSYLELAASSLGLAGCWAGLMQLGLQFSPALKEFVGLPESHTAHYPMMLGYSQFKYHRLPERKTPIIHWKEK